MSNDLVSGKVWMFGSDINTDLIMPSSGSMRVDSEEEQAKHVFEANRPGWVKLVQKGDFIVAGLNFGTGSSRPAARSLRNVGISCLLADSINGLFFRNAVNFGLLALECPGITSIFEEGQTAEVSLEEFQCRNRETGAVLPILPVPTKLLAMMRTGGLMPVLEERGLIAPLQPKDQQLA